MGQLLSDLGLKEGADKASSPATVITYLVFVSRLLATLRAHSSSLPHHKIVLSQEMQKDVIWWLEYIRTFNGVNFIINPATIAFTYKGDACLDGGGGFHGEEYWSRLLPQSMLGEGSPPIHL